MPRSRQIAVIGDGRCSEGDEVWALAEEVGRRLAEAGCVLFCGGLGGVMEAASKGASEAGGTVIGISPGDSPGHANDYCTHVVASSIGQGRNLAVVSSGEAVIAVGGAWGTLSEIGFAQKLGRPVIGLRTWSVAAPGEDAESADLVAVNSAEEAVARALEALG